MPPEIPSNFSHALLCENSNELLNKNLFFGKKECVFKLFSRDVIFLLVFPQVFYGLMLIIVIVILNSVSPKCFEISENI